MPGEDLFRLYDTFGLPQDMIRDLLDGRKLTGDWAGYETALARQREQSKKFKQLPPLNNTRYNKKAAGRSRRGSTRRAQAIARPIPMTIDPT